MVTDPINVQPKLVKYICVCRQKRVVNIFIPTVPPRLKKQVINLQHDTGFLVYIIFLSIQLSQEISRFRQKALPDIGNVTHRSACSTM